MPGDIKTKDIELQPMGDSADAAQVTFDPAVLQATLAEMQVRIAAQFAALPPLTFNCTLFDHEIKIAEETTSVFAQLAADPFFFGALFDPKKNSRIDFGAQLILPMLPEHFHERLVDPITMRALTEMGIFDRHPTVDLSQFLTNPNGARAEACDVPRGWQPSTPGAGGDPS